jgi:uncharacterized membrane protein YphA (DoxX/SURF4 family)
MDSLTLIIQIIIAVGIINVWLFRFGKATEWRGGSAKNMQEEFSNYGLPKWFMLLIGFLKVTFALLLLVGIWFPFFVKPAALGIAVLMIGAIAMHIIIKDPLKKSLPAFIMLILSLFVAGV